ncbi:MAG: succinylglutamate desuccinylase/aspartoacylase family protein, partial [Oceanihabitans sp.]
MITVNYKPTTTSNNSTNSTNRIIGKIQGANKGPTLVFFAGIHGNETAGVIALKKVFKTLIPEEINGTIYGIIGNLTALSANQRYIDADLNRLWTKKQLQNLKSKKELNNEEEQQIELLELLNQIINTHSGPFYFIDFHTTSSKTLPFITINDALINRKFSSLFPVPIVLGIEEYLNGPLLSYINELGYVSLGFESGQHQEEEAIQNCISFIHLAMVFAKAIPMEKVIGFPIYYNQLKTNSNNISEIFEVVYLHRIQEKENFKMKPDFKSFENIYKKTELATSNNKPVLS